MNDRFASWAMTQMWMLFGPVAEEALRVLNDREAGVYVDETEVARIVGVREARRARVVAERMDVASKPRGMSRVPAMDRGYTLAGSIAVVPVDGILCKYADKINGMSQPQGLTPEDLRDAIHTGLSDHRSKGVLLDIDSPGGTVAGGEDLVEAIRDAKGAYKTTHGAVKPVIGYYHDLGCSGAVLAGSQCDEVYCSANATVGSIGVYQMYRDTSEAEAKRGKLHLISSGPYKGAGADGTPITPDHLDKFQARVNDLCAWFVERVAEGRDMSIEAVRALATGETWVGRGAHDVGLVDGVIGFRELVAGLNDELE